jgi:hypothetical protein
MSWHDNREVAQYSEDIQARLKAGMGCGSSYIRGWSHLIELLNDELKLSDPEYKIDQIKEKFGMLRFYTEGVDSVEGNVMIDFAEEISSKMCMDCGHKASIKEYKYHRMAALCDTCAEEV